MSAEIAKADTFVSRITSDEVLNDLSQIAQAIAVADRIERVGITAKLYLIAETINRHGMNAALEVLSSNFGHSDAYCGALIKLVVSIGIEMLRDAVLHSNLLTLDQWKEISTARLADKKRLYDMAVNHDPPALEMRAHVNGISIEEQKKKDVLSRLNAVLNQIEKLNLRNDALEILMNHGYIKRMITSPGAKK